MAENSCLPFELTSDALNAWTHTLNALPQIQAAHQLNQVLKQLKSDDYPPDAVLPLLISLTPQVLHLSAGIASAAQAEIKLSDKSRKAAKLSMQLLRQSGLIFCQLAEQNVLTVEEQQAAIYYALQCIGYCMRDYCQFYETPSATLWKKSAQLYSMAARHQYLNIIQTAEPADFNQQASIESVIKRNLLFAISMPTLNTPNVIGQLFRLANQYADQLIVSTTPSNYDFGFYWDLNDEQPPCPTRKPRRALPHGFLAIDSHAIGLSLQQETCITQLDRNLQAKLALHLTNYQAIFDSIVPGLSKRTEFLFGFNDVSTLLAELNKLEKIRQHSGHGKNVSPKRNLALVPLEREKNAFETMGQKLAQHNTKSKQGNVLKIALGNYLVTEGLAFDCNSGDLAIFYREDEPATLAIIRHQSALSISNVTHILMEKIIGFYSIYSFKAGKDTYQAIVIDEDGDQPQVFLPPGKYGVDTTIPLTINESLHLTACLENSPFFARFSFRFDS
ncbi:MAG: hypothetical protein PHH11_12820 [Methylomonas sp.]|nr:hypothetical protein [Methylomonas sp.]